MEGEAEEQVFHGPIKNDSIVIIHALPAVTHCFIDDYKKNLENLINDTTRGTIRLNKLLTWKRMLFLTFD